jgi:bifunctional non-homologous end joining protein LigD
MGSSHTVSSQIRKQLNTDVSLKSKLTKPLRKPKATWVEPKFVAADGVLRATSFKGLSKGTRRT